jgi:hypothetical protein
MAHDGVLAKRRSRLVAPALIVLVSSAATRAQAEAEPRFVT